MAFDIRLLNIGRGGFNNYASPPSSAIHNYTSSDDIILMGSPGYFPPYLGYTLNEVKVGDLLILNSWLADGIANDHSLNYIIESVNPLQLHSMDEAFYNNYSVGYSGAASGSMDFAFLRDPFGFVTFFILTTFAFTTGAGGGKLNLDFSVPPIYQPSSNYGSGGVLLPLPATVTSAGDAAINLEARINTTIVISQMPDVNIGGSAALAIHNNDARYLGLS